ncbi:MAG: DVUA0089 family protein [Planctomycetaceae bacterium]|nr:DVUA0089 family protein [Planctomycetaceae bacterium]
MRFSPVCESYELRVLLTANAEEIYAWNIVNVMRENPSRFADQLEGMYRGTINSAHGYSKSDPIWTDLRDDIRNGSHPEHFWEALALMRAQPNLGPLAWMDSLEQRSVDHNRWMETHCYAHSGDDPECFARMPGFNQPGINGDPHTISAADLGSWSNGAWSENIGYSSGNTLSATRNRFGSTGNAYRQRLAYADIIGFMTEVNSSSLGHLKNLLSRDRASSSGFSLAAQNKNFSQRNAIGIDYNIYYGFGSNDTNTVATHTLSQHKDPGGFVTGLAYRDRNNNGFYDVGEGVDVSWTICHSTGGLYICDSWITNANTGRDHGAIYDHLPNGVYTITASAGGRQLGTRRIAISNGNVKVTFRITDGFGLTGPDTTPVMVPDSFDSSTPNNTSSAATDLGTVSPGSPFANQSEVLSIHDGTDSDWFKFEILERDANARIHVGFTDSEGDIDTVLYRQDSSLTQIASSTSTSNDEVIEERLAPGVYYLNVYGYSGDTNFYSLTTDVESLPYGDAVGDTLSTALNVNLSSTGKTVRGSTLQGEDVDMYRFTLPSQQRLSLVTRPIAGGISTDTYLRLFNSSGTELASDDDSGAGFYSQINEVVLPAGTYYVAVSGFEDQAYSPSTASNLTSQAMGNFELVITHLTDDVAGWNSQTGRWSFGESDGTTLGQRTGPLWNPSGNWDMHTGDVNGDGQTDIVGRHDNGAWYVIDGDTQQSTYWGRWGSQLSQRWNDPRFQGFVAVADMNADGFDDVVGKNYRGEIFVSLSTGGEFGPMSLWGRVAPTGWTAHRLGDFNGDGLPDIVSFRNNGDRWVNENTGHGTLLLDYYGRYGNQASRDWRNFMTGDFNGDGRDDIVQQDNFGNWWLGHSNGLADGAFTQLYANRWDPAAFSDFQVGDFNGDGKDEFVARTATNHFFVNITQANNRMVPTYFGALARNRSFLTQVGDYNGDGVDDILAMRTTDAAFFALNSTGSRFSGVSLGSWTNFTGNHRILNGEFD